MILLLGSIHLVGHLVCVRCTVSVSLRSPFPPLVLMSPETAALPPWCGVFLDKDFRKKLTLIAVDEAHCIAEWLDVFY